MSRPFLDAGDGLELRRLEPSDAEELQAVIEPNRERLRAWMWWADGSTVETTRAFIQASLDDDLVEPLGIVVDDRLVGAMGAHGQVGVSTYEIGYWIADAYEGRGIVSRACEGLITHLFRVVGCHRIVITAGTANARSRAIPERLGFTHEGALREAGHNDDGYFDLEVYGLLEHEWTRR